MLFWTFAGAVAALGRSRAACRGAILVAATSALVTGCSAALPRPPAAQVSGSDYVPVPFSPRTPPVEFIPPRPNKKAVWVDGSWVWAGNRYGWRFGSWVIPPPGARHARWVIVRRPSDGQLFFAPSTWKDASGNTIEDRSFMNALGPQARARSRPGGAPPGEGPLLEEEPGVGAPVVDTGDDDEDGDD